MSKRIISVILSLLLIASIGTVNGFTAAVRNEDSDSSFPEKLKTDIELSPVGEYAFDPDSEDVENDIISQAEQLPDAIDLRNYNGMNYVTPVKFQNPYGTCWAFSIAGASEISYLYENGLGVPAGEENNSVDFSEKFIAWYMYHMITEDDVMIGGVRASQIGEGYDPSEAEATNKNAVYNFGGWISYASNFFASGMGPAKEDFPVNDSYPYYYAGNNRWRICDREMTDEVAALRTAYFKAAYRGYIDTFIERGYFESADEYDDWFDENWGEGFFLYTRSFANSYYASYDDWSLPLNAEYRFPAVASFFKNSYVLPAIACVDEDGNYYLNEVGIAAIKSEIARGHGVSICYYADQSRPNQKEGDAGFMNTKNWAQYTNDASISVNHGVTVVGYDDNYPKENFTRILNGEVVEGSTPPGDGALIVKNSWGALTEEDKTTVTYDIDGNAVYASPNANSWGYEDSGYFYLSYYDHTLSNAESFEFYKKDEIKYRGLNYDQYDLLQGGLYEDVSFTGDMKTANIFDAEEDEYLCQISYMTVNPETTVHYAVYKDVEDDDPSTGILLEEGEHTHELGGYQRIDLKREYFLEKGEKYSVVVSQRHDTDDAELHDVVISYAFEMYDGTTINGVINEGESFMLADDKWYDLSDEDIKEFWIDAAYREAIMTYGEEDFLESVPKGKDGIHIDNYPIKAFLVPASIHEVKYILGDADLDNEVTIADATVIQRSDAMMTKLDYITSSLADIDKDKAVTIIDATWVQRYLAGMDTPYAIGEYVKL